MQQNRLWHVMIPAVVVFLLVPSLAQAQTKTPAKTQPRVAQRSGDQKQAQPAAGNPNNSAPARTTNERAGAARLPNGPVAPESVTTLAPKAPFVLTEADQKLLDQILIKWEQQSDKIKTFKCEFDRYEYNPTFGDPSNRNLKSEGQGYIYYKAPDRGEYSIAKSRQYDFNKKVYEPETENLDHWTCDGQAIYEFDTKKKLVVQRMLPAQLQGKAITEGPLPFVFGAKADQLKRRYWMRDVTPKEQVGKQIWLEAFPKFQRDAANFEQATIILNESTFMPFAIRIVLPGENQRRPGEADNGGEVANIAYVFRGVKANDPLAVLDILKPKIPLGWRLEVEKDATETEAAPAAATKAAEQAPQASRPSTPTKRK